MKNIVQKRRERANKIVDSLYWIIL
jgi:hypothetical protein